MPAPGAIVISGVMEADLPDAALNCINRLRPMIDDLLNVGHLDGRI